MEVPQPHAIGEPAHILEDEVLANERVLDSLYFLMTVSETVMAEAIPYSNIGLTHCL